MRLNCINRTAIVAGACKDLGDLNPRFGNAFSLGQDLFKYQMSGNSKGVFVEKVDLGELFKGLPQDISGLSFEPSLESVEADLGVDATLEEPLVDNVVPETVPETDSLGVHFCNWKRLVGLSDLSRNEVDLGVADDLLYVEARRSIIYRGTVAIKIK